MCRLFISNSNKNMIEGLYKSLIKASKKDIFYNGIKHNTGWGYYITNPETSLYYKSSKPIFDDKASINLIDESKYYAIFHSRLAAKDQPVRGFIDSHPYLVHTQNSLIVLAHNGVVDKYKISKEVNVNPKLYTDSEVLGLLFSKFDKDIDMILYQTNKYIKDIGAFIGTFNVIAIKIDRFDESIRISSACISDYPEENENNYKKMVLIKNENGSAAMSSTVAYYYGLLDDSGKIISKDSIICKKGVPYLI
ncbi:hypothetical protein [Caldisphaera sp.]|uniref:class II glutamine amidotransferase n=1 Tax=Caldisphaera sp. TaxID=2060322 RepID=UPI0025B9594E|nr:hypothetical protein [Caldisphaera sp.]